MLGKNHSAQDLTIRLLRLLPPEDRAFIFLRTTKDLSEESAEHLNLCVMMANELDLEPDKYNHFETLCKAVLARQKEKDITREKLAQILGLKVAQCSINKTFSRLNDHRRKLNPEEIRNICEGFQKESHRHFWENQFYLMYPDLAVADTEDGPVLEALQALWRCLSDEIRDEARKDFPITYENWFRQLCGSSEAMPGSTETGLYQFIENMRVANNNRTDLRSIKISKDRIIEELVITRDTFQTYKREWEAYEQSQRQGPVPSQRLTRIQLQRIAVFLDMDFYTTVGLLASGGYCFHDTEPDITVAKYLFLDNHNNIGKQDLLDQLLLHLQNKPHSKKDILDLFL